MRRFAPIAAAGILCLLLAPAADAASKRAAVPKQRRAAQRILSQAQRVAEGRGVKTGRELTGVLRELAIRLRALPPDERREATRLLARPDDSAGAGEFTWTGLEAPTSPHCTTNFCVHWPTPVDAPGLDLTDIPFNGVPDYVETMANELQNTIRTKEVGTLGWRAPPSDGDGKTDVYIVDFADSGIFGVTAIDPGQSGSSRFSYLLMDDDYSQGEYGSSETPLDFLRITGAHEFNHVLQFGYDVFQDTWVAEATAVWMEDQVYPGVDDYVRYLDDWAQLGTIPLTRFNTTSDDDPLNVKVYGSAVWNRWLVSRYSAQLVRDAWESSILTNPASFGPAAYDVAIRAAGGRGFFDEFTRFAAATAEWRATTLGISESSWSGVPDVARDGDPLAANAGFLSGALDHTAFGLVAVPATGERIKLIGTAPKGTDAAFALVGRTGDAVGGTVTTPLAQLPDGGLGVATLTNPGGLQRITAVLVNADSEPVTFDGSGWLFARDGQTLRAWISSDFTAPTLTSRSPEPDAKSVSTGGRASATFSEPVSGVSGTSFHLTDPDGALVPASVSYDSTKRKATLKPDDDLDDTTRYTARLGSGILDVGTNALAAVSWSFRTVRRPPRYSLSVRSRQRRSTVLRRGILVTLRSKDEDGLRFTTLASAGRRELAAAAKTVGRKRGSLRSRKKVRLRIRLKRAARRAARRGPLRLRIKVTLRDPQGNVRRSKRRVVVR